MPPRKPAAFGPKSGAWLAELGLHTPADLAGRDPLAIYLALKARRPREISLNMLWALLAWQLGCPPTDLPPDLKADLRARLAAAPPPGPG